MDDTNYSLAGTKKILIVEDELPFRQIYRDAMHMYGFTALEAEDGEEALKMIKIYKPDLVLLDLILPKMSGFDVLRQLRSSADSKNLPVIVYSVLDDKVNIDRALKLGAQDFTFKGQTPAVDVVAKIRALLEPSPEQNAAPTKS